MVATLGAADVAAEPAQAEPPAVDWLALGDSYSSGEGISGTQPPAEGQSECARATGSNGGDPAWAVVAHRALSQEHPNTQEFVACTGAIADQASDQIAEAQTNGGPTKWDLVTFSFGGNNIRFKEVLLGCLDLNSVWGALDLSPGCDVDETRLRQRVDMLVGSADIVHGEYEGQTTLPGLYDTIADAVRPGGHAYVLGYPHLVEETSRWSRWRTTCEGIRSYDVAMLRSATGYLNEQIALAVQRADEHYRAEGIRFHFVDISTGVYETSNSGADRHALCAPRPWINGVTLGLTSGDWRKDRSFHPNERGHAETGAFLANEIRRTVDWNAVGATSITESDLMSAPVPSLCNNPPGTLVDGELPGVEEATGGFVALASGSVEGPQEGNVAFGDFDADGIREAAAIVACSYSGAGGATTSLVVYEPGPELVGVVPVQDYLADQALGRDAVTQVHPDGDGFIVSWLAGWPDDITCCPSRSATAFFHIEDGEFVGEELSIVDDVRTLEELVAAANSGDRDAAAGLADAWVVDSFIQSHNDGLELTLAYDSCTIHPSLVGRRCFVTSSSGETFDVHMTQHDGGWRATSYEVLGGL
jgi:hypothetical protein